MTFQPPVRFSRVRDVTLANSTHIAIYRADFASRITESGVLFAGIDPGIRNMGIAFVMGGMGSLYQIKLPTATTLGRLDATERVLRQMNAEWHKWRSARVCIEQASYGHPFGQVPLGENRAAAAMYLKDRVRSIQMMPPLSIRKQVFGSAKVKAEDVWAELPGDAASALACALANQFVPEVT